MEEIFENLYNLNPLEEKPSREQFESALTELEKNGLVKGKQIGNRLALHLDGTEISDNSEYNQKLLKKVERWAWIFKTCPFIEIAAVCNNLSFGGAKRGSDIDLFIVAGEGRLFTGRIFITALTQVLGLRRHGKKISERFCLSFLVDKGAADVYRLAHENDIYFTYWLKNLQITYARNDASVQDLIDSNKYWLSKFLHHPNLKEENISNGKNIVAKAFEFMLSGRAGDFIENKLKSWQLKRAASKAENLSDTSGTVITEKILKFHDIDRRKVIQRRWETKRDYPTSPYS